MTDELHPNIPKGQSLADLLEDYARINNELVNLQRQLSKNNKALSEARNRLEELIQFLPTAQIVLSSKNDVLLVNQATETLLASSGVNLGSLIDRALEVGSGELLLETDNAVTHVEVKSTSMVWDTEKVKLLSLEDITNRKLLEEQRAESDKLQGVLEMAKAAAHEFSQPLQSLQLDLSFVMSKTNCDDPDLRNALEDSVHNIQKLAAVVNKTQKIVRYQTTEYVSGSRMLDIDKASCGTTD